jgi:hypothetical protein
LDLKLVCFGTVAKTSLHSNVTTFRFKMVKVGNDEALGVTLLQPSEVAGAMYMVVEVEGDESNWVPASVENITRAKESKKSGKKTFKTAERAAFVKNDSFRQWSVEKNGAIDVKSTKIMRDLAEYHYDQKVDGEPIRLPGWTWRESKGKLTASRGPTYEDRPDTPPAPARGWDGGVWRPPRRLTHN